MKLTLALAVLLGVLPAGSMPQSPGAVPSDSARLQGAWAMVSGSADGVAMPPSLLGSMRRVLTGDSLVVTMGGQVYFKAKIQLDAGRMPKTIDYHMTAGFTAGAIQHGIYRLAGDTVYFCFGAPDAARPTEFTTVPGDRRTLSAWVRRP